MVKSMKKPEGVLDRPPIVAVLGHVDHGKTSILDAIRKTNLVAREVGGITQSIGAYQIAFKGQTITFIDTPGHQAFSQMRARGGQVADLVVLVVAADDGAMPQTLESLEHIKSAAVPFLVALNKIDLPGVDIEKVKKQLVQNGVLVEGQGGDVVCVPVSAKTGQGIEELLEMIVLLAQIQEIKVDPEGPLEAIIIESKKGKAGPTGTVIIKNGTLRVGEQISVEGISTKIRNLIDESGKSLKEAGPGKPAELLGFEVPPPIGAKVVRTGSLERILSAPHVPSFALPEKDEKLRIILKADSAGSIEALRGSLSQDILIVSSGIGNVSDSDVFLAQTTQAKIFAFKVKTPLSVTKLAENEKVEIKTFEIIYQFLEAAELEALQTLKPVAEEEILGKAEIIAEFLTGGSRIAGCRVIEGKINKGSQLRLLRKGNILGLTIIISMQKRAKTITEAKLKEEFGAVFDSALDFKIGDMLVSFQPKLND